MKKELKKHNTLTDGFIPNTGKALLPDKLLNALFWRYEEKGDEFTLSMSELRSLLGLVNTKDDKRIIEAIRTLMAPIQIRDFTYKGRGVEWVMAPFLSRATKWKDDQNYITIKLDDMIIEGLKQKAGYTQLELNVCNQFKTKYGLKLYEMFIRYYHLPNREGKGVGTVSKNFEDLNQIFSTNYKTPSELKRGVDRGLKEIKNITGEEVFVFYNKPLKSFVFSWEQKSKYPKLRIPYKRIDELIDWYLEHQLDLKIKNIFKYKADLKLKILEDNFDRLDEYWGGMLKYKYGIEKSLDAKEKYKDFTTIKESKGLL